MVWIEVNERIELELLERIDRQVVPYTIEGITKETEHSRNTVRKYLEMLETQINTYFDPEDIMLKVNNQKIDYFRSRNFCVQRVVLSILEENLTMNLVEQFLFDEFVSLEQFCQEHYVSHSSMRRKLKKVNEFLKTKQLRISLVERTVIGREEDVRHFYYQLYWSVFRGVKWPFPHIDRDSILQAIDTIEKKLSLSFRPSAKEKFAYFYAISAIRRKQGHTVRLEIAISEFMKTNPFYKPLKEVIGQLYLGKQILVNESELLSVLIVLQVTPGIEDKISPWNSVLLQHREQNTSMYQVSQFWIHSFEHFFDLSFPEENKDEILQKLIRCHYRTYLLRHDIDFIPHYKYSDELRDTLPIFNRQLEEFFTFLQKSPYKETFINKEFLFPRYALIALKHLNLVEKEKQIVLAIETDSSKVFEDLIKEKIVISFGGQYDFKYVKSSEPHDLLIANYPLEGADPEKTIYIRSEINTRDWLILGEEFAALIKRKQKK
ncbi:hypothetical protein BAU15_13770 [Enterococcus sp. JM4C]|uniref:helix-turn-helix domain-containing protein n=1 Tax=Candidatus Enterococcus huntleyi TaxID=1857217 RepID=UPI00137A6D4E|nr:helix-turn-helix domain-containing protein [Enterococcus sp. JM4C]KAF1298340.1 hypothetical protein BAU15_13770 [Enterococcus sp. JM4C]